MLAMRYATKMHFRTRQNVIQLIRTTYESEKKRGVNSIVGTVPLSKPVLSAELQGQLTSQEAEASMLGYKRNGEPNSCVWSLPL